ncbi:phosphorylcholine transferase LicD [Mycobacterium sp. NPDC048908]|uniref:LicD family protein n=1 Tax=Mycobacterium sp. NPDC048908 TaxID=3364292 RepID=UPI0037242E36
MPSDRLSDTSLVKVQEALFGILVDFDAVCRELDIPYWLDGGNLLGAVRNGGFIPWDDDLDVAMLRTDLIRFREAVVDTEFAQKYSVQSRADDPLIQVDLKVYLNGTHVRSRVSQLYGTDHTKHPGLFLDVTIEDSVSQNLLARKLERLVRRVGWMHPYARQMLVAPQQSPFKRLARLGVVLIPKRALARLERALDRRADRRTCDYLGNGRGGMYSLHPIPREAVFPLTYRSFCGRDFPVPADCHAYLCAAYGPDYMTPTPPDQRLAHFVDVSFAEERGNS